MQGNITQNMHSHAVTSTTSSGIVWEAGEMALSL